MAESIAVALIGLNAGLIIVGLAFLVWLEIEHRRQVDALTSKIMARDYVQYATHRKDEIRPPQAEVAKEKKKELVDPVLGRMY